MHYFLDITDEVCPMTFVRTKLLIETMTTGDTAEIRLMGAEPLSNVPRAVEKQGHQVLSLEMETAGDENTVTTSPIYRLSIRKG